MVVPGTFVFLSPHTKIIIYVLEVEYSAGGAVATALRCL
jgi:hypothetical protein